MPCLPALFAERLKKIIPPENYDAVLAAFSTLPSSGLRINTLKIDTAKALTYLNTLNVPFQPHPAIPDLYIFPPTSREKLFNDPHVNDGRFYWQAPSSALPAVVLDPKPGERILDVCAAPGSKTTQMSALMKNSGEITGLEVVKGRFFKLKSVCTLTGAQNVKCLLTDARRYRAGEFLFDKVLVDAPCSSEGRFNTNDKDSFGYWSPRKIKEMNHKQKGILLNAGRCLKPGGTLVYSTCTFSPEENETVMDWFLKKGKGEFTLEAFTLPEVPRYATLTSFDKRQYKHDLSACWRVLPGQNFTGFFIAKFIKH